MIQKAWYRIQTIVFGYQFSFKCDQENLYPTTTRHTVVMFLIVSLVTTSLTHCLHLIMILQRLVMKFPLRASPRIYAIIGVTSYTAMKQYDQKLWLSFLSLKIVLARVMYEPGSAVEWLPILLITILLPALVINAVLIIIYVVNKKVLNMMISNFHQLVN